MKITINERNLRLLYQWNRNSSTLSFPSHFLTSSILLSYLPLMLFYLLHLLNSSSFHFTMSKNVFPSQFFFHYHLKRTIALNDNVIMSFGNLIPFCHNLIQISIIDNIYVKSMFPCMMILISLILLMLSSFVSLLSM